MDGRTRIRRHLVPENLFSFRWTYLHPNAYSGFGTFRGFRTLPAARRPVPRESRHLAESNHSRKRRKTFHGNTIHTTGGTKCTKLSCPVHHCHGAVRNLWVSHQP